MFQDKWYKTKKVIGKLARSFLYEMYREIYYLLRSWPIVTSSQKHLIRYNFFSRQAFDLRFFWEFIKFDVLQYLVEVDLQIEVVSFSGVPL